MVLSRKSLVFSFLVSFLFHFFRATLSLTTAAYSSSVLHWLDAEQVLWSYANLPHFLKARDLTLVRLEKSSILLHLIPTPTNLDETLPPNLNKRLTDWVSIAKYNEGYRKIIHLHQDVWLAKNDIVKSRLLIQSGEGIRRRIFARKTYARRVNATSAMAFLNDNHLWGATRAKYYYGLFQNASNEFDSSQDELVALATFSARRKVQRQNRTFKSHELLRFCSQRDATVVGGISKLCKSFIRDVHPDDIVTVVDRDWGEGTGWHSMFEPVSSMDPLVMVVNPLEPTVRRHLIGSGITNADDISSVKLADARRIGLPPDTLSALGNVSRYEDALQRLAKDNFFPVYDTGVQRLIMTVANENDHISGKVLWRNSQPRYAQSYYSSNSGIVSLLTHAASGCPPLDSDADIAAAIAWKASGTASSAKLIFSAPSSMECNATVEVRQRDGGWRTVGIVGGTNPSIHHSVYKVDDCDRVEAEIVVAEFIKAMAVLCLAGQKDPEQDRSLRFLHFGYGAGTLVRFLSHKIGNSEHVAVELDSGVIEAENTLLSKSPNVSILNEDALHFVEKSSSCKTKPFDCICIDVFDGNLKVPKQFYTTAFLKNLTDHLLVPDGIMVQNYHSGGRKRGLVIENATRATSEVFEDYCWVQSLDSKPNGGNAILLASKFPLEEDAEGKILTKLARNALVIQSKYGFTFDAVARVQTARKIELYNSVN